MLKNKRDLRVMQQHDVIGLTTTGCASRWEVLQALRPEVLICEEAAEVMEAHALCSLFPSLQHGIFIGDPLQLRPDVKEQTMSLETRTGSLYRLDESLFERIMMPRDPAALSLPTSQLNIQRRMHPQIAALSRVTYPFLQSYETTALHPKPKGIESRLLWLDHRMPEMIEPEVSDSVFNPHEVELVAGLVHYLLRGSGYSYGDIAVLTPYAAQLSKLHEALKSTCSLWLSDKDREMLIDNEQLDESFEHAPGKAQVEMGDMLRIATVDNFQGEEAKVIILSTVRSGGKPGFLRTENRINVACSRARDGFYIVGNAETLLQVDMWRDIISIFDRTHSRSASLLLRCDRHPQHFVNAKHAADFETFEDCTKPCDTILGCGHHCQEKCHDLELHDRIPCSQPCQKLLACGHPCQKSCSERCGSCNKVSETIKLDCEHEGERYCSGEVTICQKIVEERNLSCGYHTIEIKCGEEDQEHTCMEKCGIKLPCGHDCSGDCMRCRNLKCHQACAELCNTMLGCGHQCLLSCHHGKECLPCDKRCQKNCAHGQCSLLCSQPCNPCGLKAFPACNHEDAQVMICSLPSMILPCSQSCRKILECGHLCPSLHNEVCVPSNTCPQCHGQDMEGCMLLYNEACGHAFDIHVSDKTNLCDILRTDTIGNVVGFNPDSTPLALRKPTCPICGVAFSAHRYESISKLIDLSDVFDRHLAKIGQKLFVLSNSIEIQDNRLAKTFKHFTEDIQPKPLAAGVNTHLILRRERDLQTMKTEIIEYRDRIIVPFEQGIKTLQNKLPNFVLEYNMMFRLHADGLECRAMYSSISDRLRVVSFLANVDDFSNELQRHALTMLEFVHSECIAGLSFCQTAIEDTSLDTTPALDAEIRLHQVRFRLLQAAVSQQLRRAGLAVSDLGSQFGKVSLLSSLDKVEDRTVHYPSTCKPYFNAIPAFRKMVINLDESILSASSQSHGEHDILIYLKRIPDIHSAGAKDVERQWAKHALGSITTCDKMHPYSEKTFPDFCPECGKYEETEKEKTKRAQSHLFEEAFLAAINKTSPPKNSVTSSPTHSPTSTGATSRSLIADRKEAHEKDGAQDSKEDTAEAKKDQEGENELSMEEKFLNHLKKMG